MTEKAALKTVKTAARTLDVFEAFCAAGEPLSITALAERIHSPVSSCHTLVKTLQARGYLYTLDQRRLIYPTKRMFELTREISRHDPLLRKIAPLMTALRDRTGETVVMGKRQGGEAVYLDVIEGTHTIRYSAQSGQTRQLYSSSIGKALLGLVSERDLDAYLARTKFRAWTRNTITDPEVLRENIAAGRAQGYYTTRGENVDDVMAIAVSLRIAGEGLSFALAGPAPRIEANFDRYLAEVQAFARDLEALNDSLSRTG
ncbi:MAG: IclR family transcriptional regulator [Alphaproteobacteria bacterium]|nr:IclR family transcriptional regulator [Alphaproteobacteria bacterium]MDX5369748.1 IclR family transcriptional regulator [Alphaproteobacteria bacterium]MDX5464372.1 IclR family transcriptional regulator [Alphaproteobacteria bacterium]